MLPKLNIHQYLNGVCVKFQGLLKESSIVFKDCKLMQNSKACVKRPLKKRQNKANSTNLYPPTKGYLRETCKSQKINPIYLTHSSPTVSFRS